MVDVQEDMTHKKLLELLEENNKLLKKMHRSMMVGRVFRVLYWLIIIGVGIGTFYFLQPYWESVRELYDGVVGAQAQFGDFSNLLFGQELPALEEAGAGE